MAAQTPVRLLLGGGVGVALAAVALLVPITPRFPRAWESPEQAAERAERELPSLGLQWGKLRGWSRVGPGWTVAWQPSHGSWLMSAWVPDDPGTIRWRLSAAPWLPGVRLSRDAAETLVGDEGGIARARDRVGRRDWQLGASRLVGALPAGGDLPPGTVLRRPMIEAVLAGLLLAGAVARHLVPGVPSAGWRRAVGLAVLVLVMTLPQLSALAPLTFEPGVRPWVAELAFGTAAVLLLGALLFAARRFPAVAGNAPLVWLPAAAAAGVLAGRLEPGTWLLAAASVHVALLVLAALAVLAGWLASLAADGLRELLRFSAVVRMAVLAALAVASVRIGGPWMGVALAVIAGAGVERGRGTWTATAALWGWTFGSVWAAARWDAALWDALIFLILGCTVMAVVYLRGGRAGDRGVAPETP
jgi:hypothetical protein